MGSRAPRRMSSSSPLCEQTLPWRGRVPLRLMLTRAKHCFWILGDAATLSSSKTIWREMVADAKERGCFFNSNDDKDLSAAVSSVIKQNKVENLVKMDTRLGRWVAILEIQEGLNMKF